MHGNSTLTPKGVTVAQRTLTLVAGISALCVSAIFVEVATGK